MTLGVESGTLHPAMQPESDAPLSDGYGQGQALSPSGAGASESPQLAATPLDGAPPGAIELIPASGPGELNPLSAVFRGRSRDVCVAVADFKAALEEWVSEHPEDYTGLALLGELNVRIGL